jgi:hypothetical protein
LIIHFLTCIGSIHLVWEWPLSRPKRLIITCAQTVLKKMVWRDPRIHIQLHQILILRSFFFFISYHMTVDYFCFLFACSFSFYFACSYKICFTSSVLPELVVIACFPKLLEHGLVLNCWTHCTISVMFAAINTWSYLHTFCWIFTCLALCNTAILAYDYLIQHLY